MSGDAPDAFPTALEKENPYQRAVGFVAVLLIVLLVLFRKQVWTGFDILFGDRIDTVIEAVLLEHWFNVVRGVSRWSEVNYFYPHGDGLGYNDGYFLYGLVHSLFRSMGADPLLASEFVNMVVKVVGFTAFFAACRRMLGLSWGWALFGAALFSLSRNNFVQAGHAQLLTVAFAPLMALLLWEAWRALLARNAIGLMIWGASAGFFYGAWLLTSYYMAWFFLFFMIFLVLAGLILMEPHGRKALWAAVLANLGSIFFLCLSWLAAITPALLIYEPKALETGARNWSAAMRFVMPPTDIFNIGISDYLFGAAFQHVVTFFCSSCSTANSEFTTGFPPVLIIVSVLGVAWLLRKGLCREPLIAAMILATVCSWLFCIRLGDLTAWRIVYDFVPGARALRVVSRYQLLLSAPITAFAVFYLADLSRRMPKAAMAVLCALLLVEEIGSGPVGLNRAQELQRVTVSQPPAPCESFFVTATTDQKTAHGRIRTLVLHNVDAMMIAELQHLPTINGFASFTPPDWNFGFPNAPDYMQRVATYIMQHRLNNVCELNLGSMVWTQAYP